MECEICGKERYTRLVEKEGALLYLCSECGGYTIPKSTKPRFKHRFGGNTSFNQAQGAFRRPEDSQYFKRLEKKQDMTLELVENYGSLIAQARQKLNLKTVELAREIFIGASYLNKIESGKLKPDLTTIKKLEKRLGISLLEKPKTEETEEK